VLPTDTDAVVGPTRTLVENAIAPKVRPASTTKMTNGLSGCTSDPAREPATDGADTDDSSLIADEDGPPEDSPYADAGEAGDQSTGYAPEPAPNTVSTTYSNRGLASETLFCTLTAKRSSAAVPMSRMSRNVFSCAKSWQPKPHSPPTSQL
jgi:hypothetical protein